jgi:outer membrane protein assembly factor BamB
MHVWRPPVLRHHLGDFLPTDKAHALIAPSIDDVTDARSGIRAVRARRLFASLTLSLALVAGACTGGSNGSTVPSPTLGSPSLSAVPPTVLRIAPAPYRLDAPVQREVAVLDGKTVYLAGGLDAAGSSAAGVFALNPTTGRLAAIGSVPNAFHDAAGAMIAGRLFVFGGGSSTGTDLIQAFDPAAGTAAVVGHLPMPLSDLSAATVGNTVYLVGGYDGHVPRREIYATTDGKTFRVVGRLPVGLRYAAVTAASPGLVIAGGQSANGPVDTVSVFDTGNGTVSQLGTLPAPVAHAAAFTLAGTTYVAGGLNAAGDAIASVAAIDAATGAIHPVAPLRKPVADTGTVSTADGALLIGGWRGGAVDQVLAAALRPVVATPSAEPSGTAMPSAGPDPALVRPFAGLLLIADRGNNRLLVMNAHKHIVWRYPSPRLPAPPSPLYFPDDAFWVHRGHAILVNEEENDTAIEIAYPSGRTLWTYGHPRVPGSSPGYLHQPDDLYPYPGGGVVVADAMNCRILFLNARGYPVRQIGTTGVCTHGLPDTVGYPNGDTPLPNGHLLLSEINGDWIDEVTSTGRIVWSHRIDGVITPSDPQRLSDGKYLVASYGSPGGVVRFDRTGKVLWTYHAVNANGILDHPSLAAPFPNGLVAVNDDYNHRVVLIDPKTNRIVWQYGITGRAGSALGYLSYPDGMDLLLPNSVIPLHVDFANPTVHLGRP